jgi:iron-sulfur cluster repair protein YtfE (RIC family)
MRAEYGRLAEAARAPRDAAHQALIEEQIAVTLSFLHHHHTEEDIWLWPTLRQHAPHAIADLDRLETQHAKVDPLIAAAADTKRPLPQRAAVLAELHEAINAHLDDEEQVVLPLCGVHISAEEWEAFGQRALAGIPRKHLPIVLGMGSTEAGEEFARLRNMLPPLVRVLHKMFWGPAYTKRRGRLYQQLAANSRG